VLLLILINHYLISIEIALVLLQKSHAMDIQLDTSWKELLQNEISKSYFLSIVDFLNTERAAGKIIFPESKLVFNAFNETPFDKVRVVILGQDPYPNKEDAMGLAFSTARADGSLPASLKNIFIELNSDLGIEKPTSGDLTPWCYQGVVLLNRTLSCRIGESNSHRDLGWREFTFEVVKVLADLDVVAILWGKSAQELSNLFTEERLIESVHPSPLSAYRGFFGSKPFSRANALLQASNRQAINWEL
jgi:uracil-DNA glycosylase